MNVHQITRKPSPRRASLEEVDERLEAPTLSDEDVALLDIRQRPEAVLSSKGADQSVR
jgi:hypothetical protein